MISVAILGSGNLAFHLIKNFLKIDGIDLKQVYSRNLKDVEIFKNEVEIVNQLDLLEEADVTIVSVSDDAIAEVSATIKNSLVVHTSGSVEMDALKNLTNKGVFYPLQSFSKEKEIDFNGVPICLEAEHNHDLVILQNLATLLKGKTYLLNSDQRKRIHVAAVFVNNFTNHMYAMAQDICKQHKVPFSILYPLISETSQKIKNLDPIEAQTGPAKRNDELTIKNHLNLLNQHQQELYLKITQSIQEYGNKL